ncbi:MAG: hypothetical protein NTV46_10495 [Verrucomicrobia bacterium]|nr:hypothetical protein [Verrucomicrobiota bacterium]
MKSKRKFGRVLLDPAQAVSIHQILIATGNIELAEVISSRGRLSGNENRYVSIAREDLDEMLEIDENPIVSISDDGAYVMIWKWISSSEL